MAGTEGVVIAGVFSRVVAYFIDLAMLSALNITISSALGLFSPDRDETIAMIVSGALIGVDFLYFVGLWTSGLQATLGMRLIRLRILGAVSAGTLSVNDALLRWLALSGAVSILAFVPSIAPSVALIGGLWIIVLLVTTAVHPLRQGLHDRWARSVIVQPAPGGSGLAIVGCLALLVILFVVVPLVLLAASGDQIRDILNEIGNSV